MKHYADSPWSPQVEQLLSFDDVTALDWSNAILRRDTRRDYGENRTRAWLMGPDGKGNCIHVEELAAWAGTIPYEIFCGISKRVPRVYLK